MLVCKEKREYEFKVWREISRVFFFFQAEDGIRDADVTGVQTCALPICKKAIGPFKQRFWDLPEVVRAKIGADLEKTFAFLFEQLRVKGTRAATDRYVTPKLDSHAAPRAALVSAPDDAEAGE